MGVTLSEALNPNIGFWDPLGLADQEFWGQSNEATIGFLRHAEIKHGRVAMAAFVGYCVQANGLRFPWTPYPGFEDGLTPPEQWDAIPPAGKLQILFTIGILEVVGETPQKGGEAHYMKGGKPGYFPPLKDAVGIPHPVPLNLYDPFGWFDGMDEATKERRLQMEINNGRLAQLGIFSIVCASRDLIVPGLNDVIPYYSGEYMGPFSEGDSGLFFVENMLNFHYP